MQVLFILLIVAVALISIIIIIAKNTEKMLKQAQEKTQTYLNDIGFVASRKELSLLIDEDKKMFAFNYIPYAFNYNDLLKYEIRQGETIIKTRKKGGVERAVVGGMLFGAAGAMVGANTAKTQSTVSNQPPSIVLYTKVKEYPQINVSCHSMTEADSIASAFEFMLSVDNSMNSTVPTSTSTADELIKLKSLLDSGVITQEEFDSEKGKILNS